MYTREVVEKKRKRIRNLTIAIIIVILVFMIEVSYYHFSKQSDEIINNDFKETITNVVNIDDIPSVAVDNLNDKISSLEFVDSVGSGLELNTGKYMVRIEENKVIVSINDEEIEYNINSPKSVVIGSLENEYVSVYILSNIGKLYNIKYDLKDNKDKSEVYSFDNVSAIDIDTGEVNLSNRDNFEPSIFFKTSDGKIYTSDIMVENQKYFVELVSN